MRWLRMGTGHQKDHLCQQRVGLGLGASPILGEERGMENEFKYMVSDPINQVYPMKPQWKLCTKVLWGFLGGKQTDVLGGWHGRRVCRFYIQDPYMSLQWLVLISMACTHDTKHCNCKYSAFLSSVSHSSDLLNMKVSWEPPKFVSSWSEMWPESDVKAVLLGTRPFNLWSLCKLCD